MKLILLVSFSCFTSLAFAKNITVDIVVTEKGFEPNSVDVKAGEQVTLKVTRKTDSTCSTSIQIPDKEIKKELPLNKTITIEIGKLEKGEIRFGCGMNMMDGGKIFVR